MSLCKYYSGGKYTAMHWVLMSAKLSLIALQVTFLSLPILFIPILNIIVPRKIKEGTVPSALSGRDLPTSPFNIDPVNCLLEGREPLEIQSY